jgi:hypothetical protein
MGRWHVGPNSLCRIVSHGCCKLSDTGEKVTPKQRVGPKVESQRHAASRSRDGLFSAPDILQLKKIKRKNCHGGGVEPGGGDRMCGIVTL